jgi:hypothetical protein
LGGKEGTTFHQYEQCQACHVRCIDD